VRSARESRLRWSAGWFWSQNTDDILFVASEQTGFGYFANFGKTRRDGAEANLSGRVGHFTLGGGYTFLNATYQSPETISGGSNSESDAGPGMDGDIQIKPGDRIPQIPRHSFKAYANYDPTRKLDVDLDFLAVSSSFARGNENNLHPAQRWKQRAGLDLKRAVGDLRDSSRDPETVHRIESQNPEDQHIEGALQEGGGSVRHLRTDIL
jgi:outer membrane receptor protein involved in Fe transport